MSGELGGNVTDRKQGSGMFGQRGPRKTPAPARQQMSFVFVFLYLCICALVFVFVFDGKQQRIMSAESEKDTCASQTPN